MAKVLIPLAQGCEELEAVTLIDLLRRAGIETITAGLDERPIQASRGVTLIADTTLDQVLEQEFDMIILPGGQPGTDNLSADVRIIALLKKMAHTGKYLCAICAAPSVLAAAGLLTGKRATCYPGSLNGVSDVLLSAAQVVKDGKIITSRGPGTAMDFALELIETLLGKARRDAVETELQRL